MNLGMNDMMASLARSYKFTERVLNICINYANKVKGAHKTQQCCFS